jgi:hypothetical protein
VHDAIVLPAACGGNILEADDGDRILNGRAEFEKNSKTVFEQIRSGKTAAPYLDIQPKEMKIQLFGDVAIATFHLDDRAGFVNRRTIVLV